MTYAPEDLAPMSLDSLGLPLSIRIMDGTFQAVGTKPDVYVELPLEQAERVYPQYVAVARRV